MEVDARAAKRKASGDAAGAECAAPALTDSSSWDEVQAWLASVLDARDCEEVTNTLDAAGEQLTGDVLLSLTEQARRTSAGGLILLTGSYWFAYWSCMPQQL